MHESGAQKKNRTIPFFLLFPRGGVFHCSRCFFFQQQVFSMKKKTACAFYFLETRDFRAGGRDFPPCAPRCALRFVSRDSRFLFSTSD